MKQLSLSRMPLRNLKAHPVRTLILFLLAAAQAACVLGGVALALNSRGGLTLAQERLGADILVYPYEAAYRLDLDKLIMQGTPEAVWAPRSQLKRVDDCDGISAVSHQLYFPGADEGVSWVVGFDPATDFVLAPWIAEGRDFQLPAGTVLVGSKVPVQGDSIELYGTSWPVGAHLEETGSVLDNSVFVRLDNMQALLNDAAAAGAKDAATIDPLSDYSVLLVRVDDKSMIESITNWLKVYVRKTKAVHGDAALTETATGISWQTLAVGLMTGAAWLVLLVALAVAQAMSMRERTGELFVWRAVGASNKIARQAVVREAALVHAAGSVAGSLVMAVVVLLVPSMAMPLVTLLVTALLSIGLSVGAGCASAAIAVRRVMHGDGQMLVAR